MQSQLRCFDAESNSGNRKTCHQPSAAFLLQVIGTNSPDEVLTAMRELPASAARDQDHLVPLVAEVVMDSEYICHVSQGPMLFWTLAMLRNS